VQTPQTKAQLEQARLREQLTYCFVDWVHIYQSSPRVEEAFVKFVVELQNQGVLKGEEISSLFFRACTEVSVDSYIKNKAAGGSTATGIFQPIDAFARLIAFMIKYHAPVVPGSDSTRAKVHYLTKILSIIVLVLAQSHEDLGEHFQQKPFFRFFSTLLGHLHSIESHLGLAYNQILIALRYVSLEADTCGRVLTCLLHSSHSINTLQPTFFPSFTFSWVALISHRFFMPKLLQMKDREVSLMML
jgi:CCR4-NOT transcription complex subunit 1